MSVGASSLLIGKNMIPILMRSLTPSLLVFLLTSCGGMSDYAASDNTVITCETGDCDPTKNPYTDCTTLDCDQDGHDSIEDGGADCDDYNPSISPDANEVCDGLDNNCDALVDDDDPSVDESTFSLWYFDSDGDNYGNDNVTELFCNGGEDWAPNPGDCNDTNDEISPGAAEITCDGEDNDCNSLTLDDPDNDTDGYGTCYPASPEFDCNDNNSAINPGVHEVCGDGVDSNCNGEDCDDWSEDFEAGPSLGPEWSTGGAGAWVRNATAAYTGSFGGKSGNINSSQSTSLSVTLSFSSTGSISFWHKESSESGYDFLKFNIDGMEYGSWSGANNWAPANFTVNPGTHTLTWTYSKDGSVNSYSDTVYIDDIEAVGGIP
jgi:hypothetical protein